MSLQSKKFRISFFVMLFSVIALGLLINQVLAHGSMETPLSRSYGCFLEGPENPTSPACRAAHVISGAQAFYDWNEINQGDANGRHREIIPDGQLCSGGRSKYAGFDLARDDWPATLISTNTGGSYEFIYRATAPHSTLYFEFYVTKDGYDPTQPLRWSDLEDTPFCTIADPVLQNGRYHMNCQLPAKDGKHLIYNIWQRNDSPEAFYSCSDVIFTDGNTTPTPTNTPDPGSCTAEPWNFSTIYNNGDVVSHNNSEWRARWWNQEEEPGTTGEWGVWEYLGPCNGPPTTPTATVTQPPITPSPTGNPTQTPTTTPTQVPTMTPTSDPGGNAWAPNQYYSVGEQVTYNGLTYSCRQAHTSLTGWEPPNVPALWSLVQ